MCVANSQQGYLRLPGPSSGQGISSGARTGVRKVPVALRAGSLSHVSPQMATFLNVYCRWQIVSAHYTGNRVTPHLNNCGFFIGGVAALGALVVACFQETSQDIVHLIGAGLAFVFVCGYMWLQAGLTHTVVTLPGHSRWLGHLRLGLAAVSTVLVIAGTAMTSVAKLQKPENYTRTLEPGTGKWHSWMKTDFRVRLAAARNTLESVWREPRPCQSYSSQSGGRQTDSKVVLAAARQTPECIWRPL
ncbi:DNA damage-regulated autophagy modulator protein 1 [Plakobranchus ocellatus]|uniref:DNA damage-regulated autophagy modulator protein 1 n=1 Tax=Plakobranchus ocellatus TaxID=259542 RepID=A0AAV3ZTV9_9GAST|nr:DNA damage-regulated autophagy modulator protein 1 [Plakobranchus ocellatus]